MCVLCRIIKVPNISSSIPYPSNQRTWRLTTTHILYVYVDFQKWNMSVFKIICQFFNLAVSPGRQGNDLRRRRTRGGKLNVPMSSLKFEDDWIRIGFKWRPFDGVFVDNSFWSLSKWSKQGQCTLMTLNALFFWEWYLSSAWKCLRLFVWRGFC